MNTHTPIYIFSVDRASADIREDRKARDTARRVLEARRIPYKEVLGVYGGIQEKSFVVHADYRDDVYQLANFYEQESVLHVDANRRAQLIFLPGEETTELGLWREVPSGAPKPEAYTFDRQSGIRWTAG